MANEFTVNQADLVTVAEAIRARANINGSLMFPDDFINSIANITSGLPNGISEIATGTFTLSGDSTEYTIEHNLGVTPNFYIIANEDAFTTYTKERIRQIVCTKFGNNLSFYTLVYINGTDSTSSATRYGYNESMGNTSTIPIPTGIVSTSYFFKGGIKYRWICGVIGDQN